MIGGYDNAILPVCPVPFHDIAGGSRFFCDLKSHPSVQFHSSGILFENIQKQGRGAFLTIPDHLGSDALAPELGQKEQAVHLTVTEAEEARKVPVIHDPSEIPQVGFQILFHSV